MDFDATRFSELRQACSPDVLLVLIESFVRQGPGHMDRLARSARDGDFAGAAHEAHQIQGFAGNFGAARLSSLALDAEDACQDQDKLRLVQIAEDMRDASRAAWVAILGELTRQAAA